MFAFEYGFINKPSVMMSCHFACIIAASIIRKNQQVKGEGISSVVECEVSMHKMLGSILITSLKK